MFRKRNVRFGIQASPFSSLSTALVVLVNIVIPVGIFGMIVSTFRGNNGAMPPGGSSSGPFGMLQNTANIQLEANTGVTFDDVAGCDESKLELMEVVDFLKYPQNFSDIGAISPRGVLLEGPPGTGKTLLARAVAGEAGVPFISTTGSEFVEVYVGVGASRVRKIFQDEKEQSLYNFY